MPVYYLSPTGDDANNGLSELKPWRSLDHLSAFPAQPGDAFRFQGGATFPGQLDWSYKGLAGWTTYPIILSSYGTGRPKITPPLNQSAIVYSGGGGIRVEGIDFQGQCDTAGVSGLYFSPADGYCDSLRFTDLDITGFTLGGIGVTCGSPGMVRNVTIARCRLHHNANGTHLYGIDGLTITDSEAWENDLIGGDGTKDVGGYGLTAYWCRKILMERCTAARNGLKTTAVGGHGGILFQDCDEGTIRYCRSDGNGDPSQNDGEGIILYGCRDTLCEYNYVSSNGLGGISLYHDEFSRSTERCVVRHNVAIGDTIGLAIVGTVLDCVVTDNNFLTSTADGVYRKACDISDPAPGTYTRRVRVWVNNFDTHSGAPLLVAVPGLRGIMGLEANLWHSNGTPLFQVRERDYASILEALNAEPTGA